jgi:hypothetical protein
LNHSSNVHLQFCFCGHLVSLKASKWYYNYVLAFACLASRGFDGFDGLGQGTIKTVLTDGTDVALMDPKGLGQGTCPEARYVAAE